MPKKKQREITSFDEAYQIVEGRVESFLELVDDEMFDCIICDPAYDSQEEHRKIGTTTRLKNWFETLPIEAFPPIFEHLYRVLKKRHHMYVFCDRKTLRMFEDIARDAGFVVGNDLTWDTVTMSSGYNWRPRTQRILFLKKGKRARQLNFSTTAFSDLLSFPAVRGDGSYPTEKPVELCEKLILNSTDPGGIIFSPFAGSAPEGEVALKHHMQYVGVDVSEEAVDTATKRLDAIFDRGAAFYEKYALGE